MATQIDKTNESDVLNEAMLRWVQVHGAQGIITTDDQLRIRGWNHWMELRTGRKSETMLGLNLLETFPQMIERKLDRYYQRALEGQSGVLSQKLHRYLLEMPAAAGEDDEQMYQSVRISPLVYKGNVVGTVTVIDDVTERVKREAELQRQLELRAQLLAGESAARSIAESASRRLQNLQMITDEALAQMSLDDLLNSSVKIIRSILSADNAGILLAETNGDLIVRATDGMEFDLIGVRVPAGTSFSGLVAQERRPTTMDGNLPPGPFDEIVEKEGIQSAAGVPLLADKRLLGVLCVGTKRIQTITEDDLRFLSLVGDRVAVAIERIRLYNAERDARAQAEKANQLKDQFLATVSHELRTPLNAILGWARMLSSGRIDEGTSRHAIEVIERNARSQAQLIDDLLDVSRIISGKLRLNICPVEPLSIVGLAVDAVRPAADAKEIKLKTNFGPDVGTIPGDPDRIQQIIWNLISNAIKFTPNEGTVEVSVQRNKSQIEIVVADTGQGIHPEFLPFVFDRFRQADATVARAHGGLGLGLAIVRHLTELHGGKVYAESEGEGRGATFRVELPIKLASVLDIDEKQDGEDSDNPHFDCPPLLRGLRVLIVDDEADSLDLMKTVLGECGAEILAASSAAEGLLAVTAHLPDVLLSDIEMPREDGYSFIRKVRELPIDHAKKILAVALTAHANKEDRLRALAAGFQVHVRKPVDPNALISAISNLVEEHQKAKVE